MDELIKDYVTTSLSSEYISHIEVSKGFIVTCNNPWLEGAETEHVTMQDLVLFMYSLIKSKGE